MDNFEIIINATYDYVKNVNLTSTDDFLLTRKLTNIILNEKNKKFSYKLTKKVSLKENIKLVSNFLNSINKSYNEYFINRLNDGTFIFDTDNQNDETAYSTYDFINKKRIIYIPVKNNLEDSFSIVHELFHDINLDETCESETRFIYTEGLSILSELLLGDYFIENKVKDTITVLNYSLYSLQNKAFNVDFNLKLLEKYLEDRYLDKGSIIDIYSSYSLNDIGNLMSINMDIIDDEKLTLDSEQSYIYGFLIALNLYSKIQKNKNNIKELFELNEMLKEYEFEDVLDYLNITNQDGELTNESYDEFKNNYKKLLKSW